MSRIGNGNGRYYRLSRPGQWQQMGNGIFPKISFQTARARGQRNRSPGMFKGRRKYLMSSSKNRLIQRNPKLEASPSELPRDSEWYEGVGGVTIAHAAAPNTFRSMDIITFQDQISIGDEETRVFDKYTLKYLFKGRTDSAPQTLYFFTVKGPSTMTWADVDINPASGIRVGLETAVAGGSKITFLKAFNLLPRQENGAIINHANLQIDISSLLNKFTEDSEKALGQGRLQPKMYLCVGCNGEASTSDTLKYSVVNAYHTRKRSLTI